LHRHRQEDSNCSEGSVDVVECSGGDGGVVGGGDSGDYGCV